MSQPSEPQRNRSQKAAVELYGESGPGALINMNLPQPGQFVGRRILKLEDIPESWFLESASETGTTWAEHYGLEKRNETWQVRDPEIFTSRWMSRYTKVSSLSVKKSRRLQAEFNTSARTSLATTGSLLTWARNPVNGRSGNLPSTARQSSAPDESGNTDPIEFEIPEEESGPPQQNQPGEDGFGGMIEALGQLEYGVFQIPVEGVFGGTSSTEVDLDEPPHPTLFILQSVGVSSFLGDFGVGKTIKILSLMPKESARFYFRTWRSTETSTSQASSIIDSFDESSRERFEETVRNETTDKSTQEKTENWYVEAEAKGSLGIASARVAGGGGGEYSSGTEEFSNSLDEAVREHTSEASSHRENTVSSSSESTVSTQQEEVIERTVTNINERRVLNFTFREATQAYRVKTHLKDVRIAFSNGNVASWREAPLSDLRNLVAEVIKPKHVDEVCSAILGMIAVVRDVNATPVRVLEQVLLDECGIDFQVRDAEPGENCQYPSPSANGRLYYRFKRGPLAQPPDQQFPVDGVVLSERELVLPTDSLLVEALPGLVDAVDEYTHQLQVENIRNKQLANARLEAALQIVESGDAEKAELFQMVFGVCCEPEDASDEAPESISA